ncbi:MAG TPA: shikimate kinase [Terriglobales bacterium]|nr:shikimate kinase [Terriglobales bacterium]
MNLLVLVGFMGCGKSTVGKLLSASLGWRFCDLDERIEARAGLSIAAIFAKRGEAAYRQLESHELLNALGEARARRTVLALGGGTFAQPQNLEPIRQAGAATVFLEVGIEELLTRCSAMANRPLFRDEASFRGLYEYRLEFYRQARFTVPAGNASPAEVAERVLAVLNRNALLAD